MGNRVGLSFLLIAGVVVAQQYTISTFAGGALPVNIAGTSAELDGPVRATADHAGNVYLSNNRTVLRLDAITGVLTLVAGNGTPGFSGDNGPAIGAQLNSPEGLAVDSAGNLYIADFIDGRVRKVSNGVITTIAGNGLSGFSGDNGPATDAAISPSDVAVDSAGNLYIADTGNNRVRKVSNGVITTVAGNGTSGFSGDNGPAASAQLAQPYGVTVDSAGNLYIADTLNNRVRKVSNGVITTIAGNGLSGFSGDNGPATSAQFDHPRGIAVDSASNCYIADSENTRIRRISTGVITTVAGNGKFGFNGDNGPATSAQLFTPEGVALDSVGNLYIVDTFNYRIRRVSNGIITTVAGGGTPVGNNGLANNAQLLYPAGVAADSNGNLYMADEFDERVRKVSNGIITTVAGDGTPGFSGDNGPATGAQLAGPMGVAVDSAGNLYIADSGNSRIRRISNGVITTVAGNGTFGFSGDNGPATGAQLDRPYGVAVDSAGNLYIADYFNYRVRKVSNGVITTVAGNGTNGFSGDNGPATSAQVSGPLGVATDSTGNLYLSDSTNYRIRKISNGIITTVAGNGNSGFSGDNGPATSAAISPAGVAVNSTGNLYIADYGNSRVRKVFNGIITTVAGNGGRGFSGDNTTATSAQLNTYRESGVAVDSTGHIYIADSFNLRVRVLTSSAAAPSLTVSKSHVGNFSQGQTGATYTVTVSNAVSAAPTSGLVTVTEIVPTGLTLVSMSGGTTWNCTVLSTCTTSAVLNGGSNYPAITVTVNVANNAPAQLTNEVSVSGGGSAPSSASDPTNVGINYLAGDVVPFTSDIAPNFGDGTLNILDLMQILFAVNNVPGFRPAACSDRFDAMDLYPTDTGTTRGGDGALDIRDLILELFRVNNLDLNRPVRPSRGGVCAGLTKVGKGSRNRRTVLRPRPDAQGVLVLGKPETTAEGDERVAVYVEARHDLVRVAVTLALGDQHSQLWFVPTRDRRPTLAEDSQPGVVAVAWLEGVSVRAGERFLLGYVVGPAGAWARVKVYGMSASGLDDGGEVILDVAATAGVGR